MLETALLISELGLYKEAIKILETACVEPVPEEEQNLLVLYHLAYLHSLAGNSSAAQSWLSRAQGSYRDFILASRPATCNALKFAIETNPEDAQAYYQLGNLLANFGRLDEAAENWNLSVSLDPSLSIPWRNLGLYYWVVKDDPARSIECYRNAIEKRPGDQTLYRDLAYVLRDDGKRPEAIRLLEDMPFDKIRRSDIIIDLARDYLDEELYDSCINLLASTPYFVNWEGSAITWVLYNQACTMKGIEYFNGRDYAQALDRFEKALSFPENLGVGRSQRTGEAMACYWKGKTLVALGRPDEAREIWKYGSELPAGSAEQNLYRDLCSELSGN
jgi:tetratricopeptide (TPR) repeat protein